MNQLLIVIGAGIAAFGAFSKPEKLDKSKNEADTPILEPKMEIVPDDETIETNSVDAGLESSI
tara:strand:+ start:1317 stop:1505 length:189 start_codon:yes stop_codon:yes gene_type:complete